LNIVGFTPHSVPSNFNSLVLINETGALEVIVYPATSVKTIEKLIVLFRAIVVKSKFIEGLSPSEILEQVNSLASA
jgi:hypothetical protein